MSHKSHRPQNNPASDPNSNRSQKESTNRHVYIEPGAKIDFVQDLREKYEAAQTDDKTHKDQQLLWTKIAAGLLLVTILFAGLQGYLTRKSINNNSKQFQIEQRPYIWYLERSLPEDIHIVKGEQMWINFDWANYGRTPALNSGGLGKIFCGPEAAQTVEKWFSVLGDATKPIVPSSGPDRAFIIPPAIPTDPKNALTFSSMRTDDILTQDQVDYILKTDNACFVGIRMQYFDAYGALYWSDICVSRQVNGLLAHCNKHNEMH